MTQPQGRGLERVALDLHVHTPASHDWRDGSLSPDELVDAAIAKGLDGIAITDHHSGMWVDKVRDAAAGKDFVIFPGVELNNLAGNEGIHLVALFDVDTTSDDIERFLAAIGVVHGTGADVKRETTTKSLVDVLHAITDFGGIAVLAHCQSSKGVLGAMRGDVRKKVIRHPAVLAVEATAEDYYDKAKKAQRKRTYDILDGNDPNYGRQLGVFQSSDNPSGKGDGHGCGGIGQRFTYFYAERPLALESLRQCFIDRDARIVYPKPGEAILDAGDLQTGFPRIDRVEITGGFLDGLDLMLHEGLTTVLGAKGSGKSLLIEFIRFTLDQSPTQPEILNDHLTKLEKRLGHYGRIAVTIVDPSGSQHRVVRDYDPANGNPFHEISFSPGEFFRCHFLSQGEIVRLAESEEEQIRFIDSFFDFHAYRRDLDDARSELADLDGEVVTRIRSWKQIKKLEGDQQTLKAQIEQKDKELASPILAEYQKAQAKKQTIERALATIDGLTAAAANARQALEAVPVGIDASGDLKDDPALRRIATIIEEGYKHLVHGITASLDELTGKRKNVQAELDDWTPAFDSVADRYASKIQSMGGDAPALNQERARLVKALDDAETRLRHEKQRTDQLKPIWENRNEVLEQFQRRQQEHTKTRQERCNWFEAASQGQIKARVEASSNYEQFLARLGEMKRGSYLTDADTEAIAKNVPPQELVRAFLRYDFNRVESELMPIATAADISTDRVRQLAEFLLEKDDYEGLLQLQYIATPTDRPEILFRGEDNSYTPLEELSVGQKCTAFLVMTLCEGDIPIVVDQPEDSLDIRSIWDDMCLRLRQTKRARQFVFTTHNSSVAVASDTDKFVVLAADAKHAEAELLGAIHNEEVRKNVLTLLEGGEITYFLKQRKYNVADPSHD